MDVDGAMAGFDMTGPGAADQLLTTEYAALVLEQKGQQPKLGRRQIHARVIDQNLMYTAIQNDRA